MSRRQNGEGTIYRRRKGKRALWIGELTLGYDERGKRVKKTYSGVDIAALQRALNAGKTIISDSRLGVSSPDDKGYTVSSWCAFWLDTYKRPLIKASTLDRYGYALSCHIEPRFSSVRLSAVTTDAVQVFYNDLRRSGLSSSAIKKAHHLLNPALRQAAANGLIAKNPCDGVVIPKSDKREARAFTFEEQRAFTANLPATVYGDFFIFALNTGLRVGEISALTWADFSGETISVNKTLSVVKAGGAAQGLKKTAITFTTPKTAKSVRLVPLNAAALSALSRRRSHQRDALPEAAGKEGLIFTSANGTPLNYHNIRRAFVAALKKSGLPAAGAKGFTIHSARHTFATRLIERGADVKTVSELLGHASVKFTLDLYTHTTANNKASAVALLDG